MSASPPTPPSDDRDQSANFWESAAPYTPYIIWPFGVLIFLWFIGRGGIGISRPKGTPIAVGLRKLMPGIIALSCLNIVFLVGGLVYRAAGGAPFRPSEESRKDNLPRDFVQLCAALFTQGNYNAEIVRWIQLSTYTLTALFVLSILGFCFDPYTKEGWKPDDEAKWKALGLGCVEDAIGDFPRGEQYKPVQGVRHMKKKTAAMLRERLKERDLTQEKLDRLRKIEKQLQKEAGDIDLDRIGDKATKDRELAEGVEADIDRFLGYAADRAEQGGTSGKGKMNKGTLADIPTRYAPTRDDATTRAD